MVNLICSAPRGLGLFTCVDPSRSARADSASSKVLVELVKPKKPGAGLEGVWLVGRGGRTRAATASDLDAGTAEAEAWLASSVVDGDGNVVVFSSG
jgi:hypothetical protein